jgi:hypothetical protein
MKKILVATILLTVMAFAQQPAQPQQQNQSQPPAQPKPCVIVQHEGSHAFRNMMLLGVAGAVISKERYKVLESNVAGIKPDDKMHGDELQARTQGAKVVVVRTSKTDELVPAREACTK